MTDKELMQMALDALIDAADSQNWEMQQNIDQHGEWYRRSLYLKQATTNSQEAIKELRARLEQPEPEQMPTKLMGPNLEGVLNAAGFYKQREWQGLTDDEVSEILDNVIGFNSCFGPETDFARAIEAKLKEKNAPDL